MEVWDGSIYQTALSYSTGIRIGELLGIRHSSDIDISNGVIYVMGKGAKPRLVMMKPKLLEVIQAYLSRYNPKEWLFENDQTHNQYSEQSINEFLKRNAIKAGITKKVHAHLIRHCYASHSISISGLYMVQQILGHSDPKITASTYIHNSAKHISQAYSPIDSLPIPDMKYLLERANIRNKLIEWKVLSSDTQAKGKIESASYDKTYNVRMNGRAYLLRERNGRIAEAPEGAKWSIGVGSQKVLAWFNKKGAEVEYESAV